MEWDICVKNIATLVNGEEWKIYINLGRTFGMVKGLEIYEKAVRSHMARVARGDVAIFVEMATVLDRLTYGCWISEKEFNWMIK